MKKLFIFLLTLLLFTGCSRTAEKVPVSGEPIGNAGVAPDSTAVKSGNGQIDTEPDIDNESNNQKSEETAQENGAEQENGQPQKSEDTASSITGAGNTATVDHWDASVSKEAITGKWYAGAIGNAAVHMRFDSAEYAFEIKGTYYYDKYKTEIPLKGYIDDGIRGMLWMTLTEDTDKKGKIYIIFRSNDYVQGFWESGETIYPMYLIREGADIEPPRPAGDEAMAYRGLWYGRQSYYSGGEAIFTPVFDDLVFYELSAYSGANSGYLEGFGILEKGSLKTVFNETVYDSDENVVFSFSLKDDVISLDSNMYDYMCGMGVTFPDTYAKVRPDVDVPTARDAGIVASDEMERAFRELTGDDFVNFIRYTQFVQYEDIIMDGTPAAAGRSYLRGMPGMCFYIIADNKIYAAYTDYETISYYTNDSKYADKLPEPMKEWAEVYDMKISYNYKATK